jgi:hypothetical protein
MSKELFHILGVVFHVINQYFLDKIDSFLFLELSYPKDPTNFQFRINLLGSSNPLKHKLMHEGWNDY